MPAKPYSSARTPLPGRALCNTAIWLDQGEVKAIGATADVIVAYSAFLESLRGGAAAPAAETLAAAATAPSAAAPARIVSVEMTASGTQSGDGVVAASRRDDVAVTVRFVADSALTRHRASAWCSRTHTAATSAAPAVISIAFP